ncbi:MAG TPA: GNAT family N-acetyltransferase [Chitinophagaceae bacterium]|nr:GNAT family N-acetyltransferase [Chitinophagaceae bacterium]
MKYLLEGEESQRLLFKKVSNDQFEQWLPFHQDPDSFRYWEGPREEPEAECSAWYKKQFWRYENNLGGMNALIEKQSGLLVGYCGLLVQTVEEKTELEIGYSLLPQFRNKGFATEAAIKCRDYAFENEFADSLISIITVNNLPSQHVAIKVGMKKDFVSIYNNNEVYIYRIWATDLKQRS